LYERLDCIRKHSIQNLGLQAYISSAGLDRLAADFTAVVDTKCRSKVARRLPPALSCLKALIGVEAYANHFAGFGAMLQIVGDVDGDGVLDKGNLLLLDAAISGSTAQPA
jgi:hypothetical protein